MSQPSLAPVVQLRDVTLRYGKTVALDAISLDLPAGVMVGLIGPDGVGKSSLFSLVSGSRAIQSGTVRALGGDMADRRFRTSVSPRIAYMAQGLGKNLYPTLSVTENLEFFARLFGQDRQERQRRESELLQATGLAPFPDRRAGKLSGGMKQKLSLCCSLIHDPDLLILDEPTTGVDPLSRRQFWELIDHIRSGRPGLSVLVSTAYMEEAERFDWLVAMYAGRELATGTAQELRERTGSDTLEKAFIALLPEAVRQGYQPVVIPARKSEGEEGIAIEARNLTVRFGDFTAVNDVSFSIERGEIFGFLGSNGCGKSTTMKVLTGLLPATEGESRLFGHPLNANDMKTRQQIGYMTQAFSLYGELTVRQNLVLHARLYGLPEPGIRPRIAELARKTDLEAVMDQYPEALPLGHRQRLSLAVAIIHRPQILILDEPTSGVDPVARDGFWRILLDLSRSDRVTIFISTHFMNEAERCDRISLMNAGQVLVADAPAAIAKRRGDGSLEKAFIAYLEDAQKQARHEVAPAATEAAPAAAPAAPRAAPWSGFLNPGRMLSYAHCEATDLRRDPIRLVIAVLGSVILMFVLGYGISLDVEHLRFAVLDRNQTVLSRDYTLSLAGSKRYFVEQPPLQDYGDLDHRMRAAQISLAVEIPPTFAQDMARGRPVEIGAWVDGAMPLRAETVRGYAMGMHLLWLAKQARERGIAGNTAQLITIEPRYRYNPDVRSLPAMVPAVMPVVLLMFPAILTALSIVREKELGSIINFYVTPVTRLEFMLGKLLPYIALGMFNFVLLTLQAVLVFRVPITGSLSALIVACFLYVVAATAVGMLVSTFVRSQIAALFGTSIATLIPAVKFSGMVDPVSSLTGGGQLIGRIFPATYFLNITRGTFSKALGWSALREPFLPLLLTGPLLVLLGVMLLRKQEH